VSRVRALPDVASCTAVGGGYEVMLRDGADPARAIQSIAAALPVARIELKRPTLEDVFVGIVARDSAAESPPEQRRVAGAAA
jgi:ABC-type uncharacterized transport system ATPase subunit